MSVFACPGCDTELLTGRGVKTVRCPGCGEMVNAGAWIPQKRAAGVRRASGCMVPDFVLDHELVDAREIVVFCALDKLCREGEGDPSIANICRAARRSGNTVREAMRTLTAIGALIKRNRYRVTPSGRIEQVTSFYKLATLEPFDIECADDDDEDPPHLRAVD